MNATAIVPLDPGCIYQSSRYRVDRGTGSTIVDLATGDTRDIRPGAAEDAFLLALNGCRLDDPWKAITLADGYLRHFFGEPPPDFDRERAGRL